MATRFIEGISGTSISAELTRLKGEAPSSFAPILYDLTNGVFKFYDRVAAAVKQLATLTGTETLTNKNITYPLVTITGDGAVTLSSGIVLLTKGSAAAITVAAPGAANIGTRITITNGSNFAHVVTFTGTTLNDGTAGANTTWTAAAVKGSSITFVGVTATEWNVESFNLGTIAP